jgi:hypothetical protein
MSVADTSSLSREELCLSGAVSNCSRVLDIIIFHELEFARAVRSDCIEIDFKRGY